MRAIPKHFDLFGQRITVIINDNLHSEQDCLGKWRPHSNEIHLQAPSDEFAQDVILQTFWHEATHAILDLLAYPEWSENERFVEQIGQAVFQVLKTKRG